jgi:hypothetical protein
MRFAMRLDSIWRPLLALFGGFPSTSYVYVTDDHVRFSFGVLFQESVPRSEIASVREMSWSWLAGIGWRLTLDRRIGLIGSRSGAVEVRLAQPRQVRFGLLRLPWRIEAICVSLEDPAGFVAALAPTGAPA